MRRVSAMQGQADPDVLPVGLPCRAVRLGLLAFGALNLALAVAGMLLPLVPTTVFLLIALWAFSKSSLRLHVWLYNHPVLGRTIRDWHSHRVIPPRAKLLAVLSMVASLAYVSFFVAEGWALPLGLGLFFALLCAFILSRPSRLPLPQASEG